MRVGERIRDLRKKKRIRQTTLARMGGISAGAVTNFEKGRRRISLGWLRENRQHLGHPDCLLLGRAP